MTFQRSELVSLVRLADPEHVMFRWQGRDIKAQTVSAWLAEPWASPIEGDPTPYYLWRLEVEDDGGVAVWLHEGGACE